ncbi:hypothetical protein Y032_0025g1274 [Ancylostoma ceylanicum]|uniref:Uncharacterized protein n=1 Tax=Ancylostoma ceylanicum TaxID=53326 RepID=A0A016UW76_9BILA|nr:hypothetical protein Y032_0025g1274 [Ancylostoma ceylanicum]
MFNFGSIASSRLVHYPYTKTKPYYRFPPALISRVKETYNVHDIKWAEGKGERSSYGIFLANNYEFTWISQFFFSMTSH